MKIVKLRPRRTVISVDLQVIFGSPSRTCTGSGVCKMLPVDYASDEPSVCRCGLRLGKLSRLPNGDLSLSIAMKEFSDPERSRWLSGSHFIIDESFDVPAWIGRRLKYGLVSLPPGQYDLQIGKAVTITFPKATLLNTLLPGQRNWRVTN